MMPPLAAIGFFVFAPSNGSYEEMERRWTSRRASLEVIGRRPVKHWMGPQDAEITIRGSVWPEIQPSGTWKIDAVASFAATGTPVPVLLGTGRFLGMWGIAEVQSTSRLLQRWGYPGEVGFEIVLERL